MGGVTFTPDDGDYPASPVSVALDVGGSANRIEYKLVSLGAAAPVSGTTTYVGTHKVISIGLPRRLWARAGDGSTWSAWQYADYVKSSNL